MTNTDRQRLFTALLGLEIQSEDRKELEELVAEDLERITPIIDDMLQQAELRGRFQAYLEEAERWGKTLQAIKQ